MLGRRIRVIAKRFEDFPGGQGCGGRQIVVVSVYVSSSEIGGGSLSPSPNRGVRLEVGVGWLAGIREPRELAEHIPNFTSRVVAGRECLAQSVDAGAKVRAADVEQIR